MKYDCGILSLRSYTRAKVIILSWDVGNINMNIALNEITSDACVRRPNKCDSSSQFTHLVVLAAKLTLDDIAFQEHKGIATIVQQ